MIFTPVAASRARPGRSRQSRPRAPRGSPRPPSPRERSKPRAAGAPRSPRARRHLDPAGSGRRTEQLLVDAEHAPELLEQALVVVDAEVDEDVRQSRVACSGPRRPTADCWPRGHRPPPALRRGSREAVRAAPSPPWTRTSRRARRRSRRRRGCCPGRRSRADPSAGPLVALLARVGRAAPAPSTIPSCRCARSSSAAVRRTTTSAAVTRSRLEPLRPVARVRPRLRRDRADERLGPRHDAPDREEPRLHRDTPLALLRGRRRRSSTSRGTSSRRSAAGGRGRGTTRP